MILINNRNACVQQNNKTICTSLGSLQLNHKATDATFFEEEVDSAQASESHFCHLVTT